MVKAADVIAEARTWIDTPVRHLGRLKGVGVDCLGLVLMVGLETGAVQMTPEEIEPHRAYSRLPNSRRMRSALEQHLVVVEGPHRDGDIGFFSWGDDRQGMHLAIMATSSDGRQMMIHANPSAKPPKVTEHGFDGFWVTRNSGHGFFRYPEIEP